MPAKSWCKVGSCSYGQFHQGSPAWLMPADFGIAAMIHKRNDTIKVQALCQRNYFHFSPRFIQKEMSMRCFESQGCP